jgi:hypothetical protein
MRQLALRIAERSFASFEGLLGWIAVSCVSTAYQQKAAGFGGSFARLSTKVEFVLVLTENRAVQELPLLRSDNDQSGSPVCPRNL